MKGFFTTFIICSVLVCAFLFFGSYFTGGYLLELLFESILGIVVVISLPLSICIHAVVSLEDKITALEKRLDALEGKKEEKKDEAADIDG